MVILEGAKGRGWEILRMEISSVEEIPSSDSLVRLTEAVIFEKLVGCGLCRVKRSYASVIKEDGLRKELILKG